MEKTTVDNKEKTKESMKLHRHLPFLGAVCTSMVTMFCIGGDDVIWLLPFFTGPSKWKLTWWYLVFMEVVVVVLIFIKNGMHALEKARPDLPVNKIMQAISSVMLTALCVFLFYEWCTDEDDDGSDSDKEGESQKSDGSLNE